MSDESADQPEIMVAQILACILSGTAVGLCLIWGLAA